MAFEFYPLSMLSHMQNFVPFELMVRFFTQVITKPVIPKCRSKQPVLKCLSKVVLVWFQWNSGAVQQEVNQP